MAQVKAMNITFVPLGEAQPAFAGIRGKINVNGLFQGKSGTVAIERNNGRQRHWFARFSRKSIVVSKSLHMVEITMAFFAKFHVNGNIENSISFFI